METKGKYWTRGLYFGPNERFFNVSESRKSRQQDDDDEDNRAFGLINQHFSCLNREVVSDCLPIQNMKIDAESEFSIFLCRGE